MAQGSWIPEACRWRILSNPKRTCIGLSLLRYLGLVSQLPKWCRIGRVAVLELLPPYGIIRSLTAMTISCIYHAYRSYDDGYLRSDTSPCSFLKPVCRNACRYLPFLLSCACGRHQLRLHRPAFRLSPLCAVGLALVVQRWMSNSDLKLVISCGNLHAISCSSTEFLLF